MVRNAFASLRGRSAASIGVLVIAGILIATLLAMVIPLRDGRDNLASHYDRSSWSNDYLVESLPEAAAAVTKLEGELRSVDGVREVVPQYFLDATVNGEVASLRSYDSALDLDLVEGRLPRPGTCEAVVSRDIESSTGVGVGDRATVRIEQYDMAERAESVVVEVVGVVDRSHPLVPGSVVTTCDLVPLAASPVALLVSTDGSVNLPQNLSATDLNSVAEREIRSGTSSGILGLIVLLLVLLSFVVLASVGRWAVRSRVSEFAALRTWGYGRRAILGQVSLEVVLLWLIAAPVGSLVGWFLGWQFMRRVGDVADPASGWWVATPSWTSLVLVSGGVLLALVPLTVLPAVAALRPSVAVMLRRRGE